MRNFIGQKWNALALGSVVALSVVSGFIQYNSNSIAKLANIQDGIQTCFKRVSQSHTAKIIGEGSSNYLGTEFTSMTEECMGEAIHSMEANFKNVLPEAWKTLTAVGSDIHWFHEKLNTKANDDAALVSDTPVKVIVSHLGTRFEKLEIKVDEVLGEVQAKISAQNATQSNLTWFFYSLVVLSPLFILMSVRRGSNTSLMTDQNIEREAERALFNESEDQVMAEKVIFDALVKAEYFSTATLFEKVRTKAFKLKEMDSHGDQIIVDGQSPVEKQRTIDKVWNAPISKSERLEKAVPAAHQINRRADAPRSDVEETVTKVVDVLSSKIFTQGIKLEINTDENVEVFGSAEDLEQVFYQLLVNSIENYNYDDPHKYLSVNMRCLGDTVLVDFFDSGVAFSDDFLRVQAGLEPESEIDEAVELLISKELIEGIKGKISFENAANDDGKIVGRKVQIVLTKAPRIQSGKLVDIQKGSKKEILKRMERSV